VELYTAVCAVDEPTVRAILVLWLSVPEVPVTVTVEVPKAAVAEAVNLKFKVVLPFAGGVTGLI